MKLSSLDYADLLRYLTYKRKYVNLNKTQTLKLLFMCYGTYLAVNGKRLFDETPKAWVYGPVFPRVYRTFDRRQLLTGLTQEQIDAFNQDRVAIGIINAVIDRYSSYGAYTLSEWSHQEGSPWSQTVNEGEKLIWGKEIKDEIIKEYFIENPVI